jgi:hypothetical protein
MKLMKFLMTVGMAVSINVQAALTGGGQKFIKAGVPVGTMAMQRLYPAALGASAGSGVGLPAEQRVRSFGSSPFTGQIARSRALSTSSMASVAQMQAARSGVGGSAIFPFGQQGGARSMSLQSFGRQLTGVYYILLQKELDKIKQGIVSDLDQISKIWSDITGTGEFDPITSVTRAERAINNISSESLLESFSQDLKKELEEARGTDEYLKRVREVRDIIADRLRVLSKQPKEKNTDEFVKAIVDNLNKDLWWGYYPMFVSDYIIERLSTKGIAELEGLFNSRYFQELMDANDVVMRRRVHIDEMIQKRKDRLKEESKGFLENMRDWYYGTKNPRPVRAAEPSVEPSFYESSGR